MLETQQHAFRSARGFRTDLAGRGAHLTRDVVQEANFPRGAAASGSGCMVRLDFPKRVGTEVEGIIELFRREIKQPDEQLLKMVADVGLKIGNSAIGPG